MSLSFTLYGRTGHQKRQKNRTGFRHRIFSIAGGELPPGQPVVQEPQRGLKVELMRPGEFIVLK